MIDILRSLIEERTPHNCALGLRLVDTTPRAATCTLPYSGALVGDEETGAIHAGAISTLMDVTSGAAVLMRLQRVQGIATLDLRIDYLRPAGSGRPLTATAECYKVVGSMAFVRAVAHDGDAVDPVAASQATFILVED